MTPNLLQGPGTAEDAIAFILENPESLAAREPVTFLRHWSSGDALGWIDYYQWLTARREAHKLTKAGQYAAQTNRIVFVQKAFLYSGVAVIAGGGVAGFLGYSALAAPLVLGGLLLIFVMVMGSLLVPIGPTP